MTEPNYKTLLTSQFTKDLRSIYNSVWNNLAEIRENLDDDMWGIDLEWDEVDYFIGTLENLAEYLEKN